MKDAICFICHEQGSAFKKQKLLRMERLCERLPNEQPERKQRHSFEWGLHSRCRYGFKCQKLETVDDECKRIARRIEPRLIQAATSGASIYHELLNLCRGDFPSVYRLLEVVHGKAKREQEREEKA